MNRSSFREWFIKLAVILLLAVLQTGAVNIISVNSVSPDLLFAFSMAMACVEKEWYSALNTALICGIFSDFVCHSAFLGYTAVYAYSAVAVYFLKNLLLKPNVFFVNALALVIFILGKTVLAPVIYFTREVPFADFFLDDVLPSAVYNMVCFFVLYLILRGIVKRREKRRAAEI